MLLALAPLVFAGGPSRCVVTWEGPATGCELHGHYQATAAGPTPKAAEKSARKQMEKVVDLSTTAALDKRSTLTPSQFASCQAHVAEEAYVNCFEDPTLTESSYCFVQLDDRDCWTGEVFQVEDVAWKAMDTGREQMCARVDARLVKLNYTDLELHRAECQASCESKTTVKCPTAR
jgi:hypothetical protein